MKLLLGVIGILAAAWVLVTVVAYLLQDRMLFYPQPVSAPIRDQLKPFEVEFEREGVVLRGWLSRSVTSHRSVFVIYYGGNGEEVSWNFSRFADLPLGGFLLMNYRGYGDSEGRPSAADLKSDALFVFDELLSREGWAPDRVVLVGRSLGSGVAVEVASQREIGGLLLVTPFDRLSSLGAHHYPLLPVRTLLRHQMDSIDLAPQITAPSLVVLAQDDQVVPPRYGMRLYEALAGPKDQVTIEGAGHNDLDAFPAYWQAVEAFLRARD